MELSRRAGTRRPPVRSKKHSTDILLLAELSSQLHDNERLLRQLDTGQQWRATTSLVEDLAPRLR